MRPAFVIWFLAGVAPAVHSLTSYANDFVDPDYILSKHFNSFTSEAQSSIIQWADDLTSQGPWSVMNKSVVPPTGNKHDYLSWAPYSWPNCSAAANTTELQPEQIWTTCPYYTRDGLFNPDGRLVNDTGAMQALGDAVLYQSISWVLTGSSNYSANAVRFVKTWFIDADTAMTPNLNYAQMQRGPNGQNGTHTGVLDLKSMTKIVSGLLILRKGNSPDWTTDLDNQMITWSKSYIQWLETSPIALGEANADNNHGTFYYNQLAALKILVNDMAGAQNVIKTYFTKQYPKQINSDGEQPLEAVRTRPYHYRAYNLAAMITNARIGNYSGYSAWDLKTQAGATIQNALDFALTTSAGSEAAAELYPNVAAVGAVYGDPSGKYAAFLKSKDDAYVGEAYFLWNQPLSDSGLVAAAGQGGGGGAGKKNVNGATGESRVKWLWVVSVLVVVSTSVW
jgi:hypothetical protein